MTQQTRNVRTNIGYTVDQASVTAAIAANIKVSESLRQVGAAGAAASSGLKFDFAAFGAAVKLREASSDRIAQAEAKATYELRQQLTLSQMLTREQQAQAAFVDRSGGSRSVGQSITAVGRGLFNAPDIGGVSTPIARGLIGGGAAIDALGLSLTGLLGIAAVAAPAILLVVGALSALSAQSEQAAARAKTIADAYTAALEAGSTAQVQALIKQKQTEIAIAEATQKLLLDKAKDAQNGLANFLDRSSADLAARLDQAAADLNFMGAQQGDFFSRVPLAESSEAYTVQAEEQAKAIERAQLVLEVYNLVFGESIIKTGDATEAEERLAELRERIADAATGIQNAELEAAIRAEQLTKQQRDERILQIRDEIQSRDDYRNSHTLTEAALQANAVAVDKLRNELTELEAVSTSTADVLAAEKQQRDNAAKALADLNEAMQREAEARQALIDLTQKQADVIAEAQSKLADALADANERRANAEADAEDRRAEIAADAAEKRQEIEADDAERRAEILKRFNADYFNAVASRDALAAFKAKQQRDEDLEKQDKAYKKQQDELDKSLAKQYAAVQKSLDKQLRTIQDNYNRQEREIKQSLDKQLAAIKKEYDAAQLALIQSQQQIKTLQANYNALMLNAETLHRAAMYKTVYDYSEMSRIAVENAWRAIYAAVTGQSVYGTPGPDYGIYPGASTGGNSLGTQNVGTGGLLPGTSSGGGNLLGVPARGSLPGGSRGGATAVYGGSRSSSATINTVINMNGANMSARQIDRLVSGAILKSARKAGFNVPA